MWLTRSVLLWIYFILLLLSTFLIHFSFTAWLIFIIHLTLLYLLTRRYESQRWSLPALRFRLLLAATLNQPVQFFIIMLVLILLFFLLVLIIFAILASQNLDNIQQDPEAFETWLNQTLTNSTQSFQASPIIPYVGSVAYVGLLSGWQTLLSWILTKGYLAMVTSFVDGRLQVGQATVYDIVAFTLVGMLGIQIGNSIILNFFLALAQTQPTSWWYAIIIEPLQLLVALFTALVSAAYFAVSTAAIHVLGMASRMGRTIWLVLGLNVVITILVLDWDSGSFWTTSPGWGLLRLLVAIAVVLAACWECARRFRVLEGMESSGETTRILGSSA